jgi:hypothetical protein
MSAATSGYGLAVVDTSTLPADEEIQHSERAHLVRWAFLVLLTAFLVAGAFNAFGVRSGTASASGGGYELEVTYAKVSRPGLATPWSFELRRAGGFDGPVRVAWLSSFFDVFDENGLDPEPTSSIGDGDWTVLEFEPPDGDTLAVSFDARVEPASQLQRVKGAARVLEDDGPVAEVRFTMWVMP